MEITFFDLSRSVSPFFQLVKFIMAPLRKKHRASERPVDMSMLIDEENFTMPVPRRLYRDQCEYETLFKSATLKTFPKFVAISPFSLDSTYGKTESEVYFLILVTCEKPRTATGLKPNFVLSPNGLFEMLSLREVIQTLSTHFRDFFYIPLSLIDT